MLAWSLRNTNKLRSVCPWTQVFQGFKMFSALRKLTGRSDGSPNSTSAPGMHAMAASLQRRFARGVQYNSKLKLPYVAVPYFSFSFWHLFIIIALIFFPPNLSPIIFNCRWSPVNGKIIWFNRTVTTGMYTGSYKCSKKWLHLPKWSQGLQ